MKGLGKHLCVNHILNTGRYSPGEAGNSATVMECTRLDLVHRTPPQRVLASLSAVSVDFC